MPKTPVKKPCLDLGLDLYPGAIAVMRLDGSADILAFNAELLRLLGCEDEEQFRSLHAEHLLHVLSSAGVQRGVSDVSSFLENGRLELDPFYLPLPTRQGKTHTFRLFSKPGEYQGEKAVYITLFRDDLSGQSPEYDRLTGLYTPSAFLRRGNEWIRQDNGNFSAERFRVFYFNVRGFRRYNFTHGIDEGDVLLQHLSAALTAEFPCAILSRYRDDHFALLSKLSDYPLRIDNVRHAVQESVGDPNLRLQVGYYELPFDDFDLAAALEKARLANSSNYCGLDNRLIPYTPLIGQVEMEKAYALAHIDSALASGDIDVYFQPVVRPNSGKVCSFECLACWEDPKVGNLLPKTFVAALEESQQIDKLDRYLLERICQTYRDFTEKGRPFFPVSFNLSRLDFLLCDMFAYLEEKVSQYRVPRELLAIEIDEAAFADDDEFILSQIRRLRQAGYRVYMDDYGAGHFPLFRFGRSDIDAVKIDMDLFPDFSAQDKAVLSNLIRLGKEVGITTIAKRVASQDQYDFLKGVGCEQIQGFYFGKPKPLSLTMAALSEGELCLEQTELRPYFDKIGQVDILSRKALCLLEVVDGAFHPLVYNPAFGRELSAASFASAGQFVEAISNRGTVLSAKWREFAARVAEAKGEESIGFFANGRFIKLSAELIASAESRQCFLISFGSIDDEWERGEIDSVVESLKALTLLYDEAYAIDLDNHASRPLLGGRLHDFGNYGGDAKKIEEYADEYLFPEDRLRFLAFNNPATIRKRAEAASNGVLSDYFRVRGLDGDYAWRSFTFLLLPHDKRKALGCVSTVSFRSLGALNRGLGEENKLFASGRFDWDAFLRETPVKMFYQDKEGHILGASLSFLRFFGFRSIDELSSCDDPALFALEKAGELQALESQVIHAGKSFLALPAYCREEGGLTPVNLSLAPLYANGKIAGLVGYFSRREAEQE